MICNLIAAALRHADPLLRIRVDRRISTVFLTTVTDVIGFLASSIGDDFLL